MVGLEGSGRQWWAVVGEGSGDGSGAARIYAPRGAHLTSTRVVVEGEERVLFDPASRRVIRSRTPRRRRNVVTVVVVVAVAAAAVAAASLSHGVRCEVLVARVGVRECYSARRLRRQCPRTCGVVRVSYRVVAAGDTNVIRNGATARKGYSIEDHRLDDTVSPTLRGVQRSGSCD
ncbi:uncharacterized protein LOC118648655 isoform X2 [Monomorium pharaonis]|uniref:uncharacterized protein LOC118648655 isoform X2 n=1 Tax=Monomorium pharaonis TaxID=307658 RepID=UPI001746E50E|nr:uncharacterized protein LOC118648655 isoform X2 [Monomorium pharaonis]